jgi:hypothetical protein
LTPLFAILFFLLGRYWLDGSQTRTPSAVISATFVAGAIVALAWRTHMLGIIPPVALGYALLFAPHRHTWSDETKRPWAGMVYGAYLGFSILFVLTYLPRGPHILGVALIMLLLVVLNNQFYLFLAAKRGRIFALAAIPFHLLYHFYNGISFLVGILRWTLKTISSRPREVNLE